MAKDRRLVSNYPTSAMSVMEPLPYESVFRADYRCAGFGGLVARLAAPCLSVFSLAVLTMVCAICCVFCKSARVFSTLGLNGREIYLLELAIIYMGPVFLFVLHCACRKSTIGMRLMGLRFARAKWGTIGYCRAAVRALFGVAEVVIFPVSLVVISLDRQHRSIADLACSTIVCWEKPRQK